MSEEKRPTLQLIADKAGVSKMTVSRVLRKQQNISPEIRQKVEKIAEALNYRKHPLVSALMADLRYKKDPKFHPIIALLHFDQRKQALHPNLDNLRRGVRESAHSQGYDVEEFYLEDPGMSPKRMIQIFNARGIRGIIFEHSAQPDIRLDLDLSNFACIAIKYSLSVPSLHRIETSQFSSILTAVEKLHAYGYKRFGLALPKYAESISQFRRSGATLYAQSNVPEADRVPILAAKVITNSTLKEWMETYHPDVVISQNPGVINQLNRLGYRIPEDIGFIHLGLSKRDGKLAGIDPNWEEMGKIAANRIIDQLTRNELGVPLHPTVTLVQGDWVDGATLPNRTPVSIA